jgi:hypothetical protein
MFDHQIGLIHDENVYGVMLMDSTIIPKCKPLINQNGFGIIYYKHQFHLLNEDDFVWTIITSIPKDDTKELLKGLKFINPYCNSGKMNTEKYSFKIQNGYVQIEYLLLNIFAIDILYLSTVVNLIELVLQKKHGNLSLINTKAGTEFSKKCNEVRKLSKQVVHWKKQFENLQTKCENQRLEIKLMNENKEKN